jgi:hypothetical protein
MDGDSREEFRYYEILVYEEAERVNELIHESFSKVKNN